MSEQARETKRDSAAMQGGDPLAAFRMSLAGSNGKGDGKMPVTVRLEEALVRRMDRARAGRTVSFTDSKGEHTARPMSRGEFLRACVLDALPRIEELIGRSLEVK